MSLKSPKIFKNNQTDLKIEVLVFYFRSSKINIKEPTKQTSQIIQNFNLIHTE